MEKRLDGILVGIDVGTTCLKVASFCAETGRLLAETTTDLEVRVEKGLREVSPVSFDRALKTSFGNLKEELGGAWKGVCGIGLAAQGGSTILADRDSGKPLSQIILWNDMRALEYMPRIRKLATKSFWREHTFRDEPGWGLARILFFKENEPELLNGNHIYVGAGEYCYFQLTGLWLQDAGNALQIGCYNARDRDLDQEMMDLVEMPLSFVAPMRRGHMTNPLSSRGSDLLAGVPKGIPVAGPYMDHEAGYISSLGSSSRPLQCSLGTAWVGNFNLPLEADWTSPFQLVLPSPVDTGWLVVQPLLTGNVTWNWALQEFISSNVREAVEQLAEIFSEGLLPPHGLIALPWFNMPNPLSPSSLGGGAFFGINPETGKNDFVKALAVSMVCEMFRVLKDLREGQRVDGIVLGGGASKAAFFQSLFGALFEPFEVKVLEDEDLSGARGALYAFDPEVAKARPVLAQPADNQLQREMNNVYDLYLNVFDRLYQGSSLGTPVTFRTEE
jgi:sugar (pentulose or hexulose) kinase